MFNESLTNLNKAEYGSTRLTNKKINKNSKLIIDPKTNKAQLALKEVSCFIASSEIDLLDENEVVAVLLHEIGHNTMIMQFILSNALHAFGNISVFGLLFSLIRNYMKGNKTDNPLSQFTTMGIGLLAFYIVSTIMNLYIGRRQELLADEFAIKMGYGEYLYLAHEKTKNNDLFDIYGRKFKKIKESNIFDRILNVYYTIIQWIAVPLQKLGLEAHPDWFSRNKMVKEKTEKFNKEMKNKLDRSSAIYGDNWYDKMMDPDVKQIKENLDIIINNVKLLNS